MRISKEMKMETAIYKWSMKEGLEQEYIDELIRAIDEAIDEECFSIEDVLEWDDEMFENFAKQGGII